MDIIQHLIPTSSPIFQQLKRVAQTAKLVVFSGLPGVGKSLYINQFERITRELGRNVTVIQWDIARKAFETPEIAAIYPMGDGVVHNGVKLSVGLWLVGILKNWLTQHQDDGEILLIEAPLVGHRFIELAKNQADQQLETFLASETSQFIVPIPSKQVRAKIEDDRRALLSDDAKTWTGAKPSVMLMLWKMICGIANEFGASINMEGQPPYDPAIYAFVFGRILQHRHFVPLHIGEIFNIKVNNEADLHSLGSLAATAQTANVYAQKIQNRYSLTDIDNLVGQWYLTDIKNKTEE